MNDTAVDVATVNPLFGQAGHLFVIIAFVAALLAAISYILSRKQTDPVQIKNWMKMARFLFFTHVISVIAIVTTLISIIGGHHFEYYYAWQHSSLDLAPKYILSCLWEGQEGSFLLWCFWTAVLGSALIFTSKKWESSVMVIICLIQIFLTSFLLGFHFGNFHIGNSPFLLLKDELTQDPVFLFGDYMKYIPDGTGLNALLQNYWMVIHPPILFLGFASCCVPFAFAMAGLWNKEYTSWIKPALGWGLFSGGVLGTGVLMGGAWAYEALSFGGFWAWDPVENASIMPWLVLVAALHTMVIAKSTGHAVKASFIFVFITFMLVLYASFLTRSGILGDTSVHSFVTSGLTGHLLIFFFTFLILCIYTYQKNKKHIPENKKEEANSSREFWMFIGSLILVFSCLHIVFFTSIPVYNNLFEGINKTFHINIRHDFAPPTDPVHYYTNVQIWIAIVIAILFAFAQFLKYKSTDTTKFFKQLIISLILSLALAIITSLQLSYVLLSPLTLLLFGAYFGLISNLQYLIFVLRGKFRISGASIAHTGFAILLMGILISNASRQIISRNELGVDFGKDFDAKASKENILLYKNMPTPMGDYIVTYRGDSVQDRETIFTVHYEKVNAEGESEYSFDLHPYLLLDKKSQNLSPNPDTKHYLGHDVFTHVSSIPNKDPSAPEQNTASNTVGIGDTIFYSKGILILQDMHKYIAGDTISAGAQILVKTGDREIPVEVRLNIADSHLIPVPVSVDDGSLTISFDNIFPEKEQFIISVTEANRQDDWIIMKAIMFPMINLVWLGAIIMAIGFFISMLRRIKENRIKTV